MPRFPQPCSVCGALSRAGSMCELHAAETKRKKELKRSRERAAANNRPNKSQLYNYAYRQEAKRIKAEATHCHICGKPFVLGDRVEADHLLAGVIGSPLAAAHRLCNQQRGNKPIDGLA